MGRPLAFYGPTQGIVQPGGLVSFRKAGLLFVLDPDVTVGWDFAANRTLIDRKNGLELGFTRASVATFYDASGNRQTAQVDEARFDHDRNTLQSLGLLMEEGSTNEFLNSDVPVTQDITTTAQDYTVSVYGPGSVTLSGTATGVATDGSPLTVTASAGTLTLTVAGGPDEVQLEAKAFFTSFIKTGAASTTRAEDTCSTLDLSWLAADAAGTFYTESRHIADASAFDTIFKLSPINAIPNNQWLRVRSLQEARYEGRFNNTLEVNLNENPGTHAAGVLVKDAIAFDNNDVDFFFQGLRVGTGDQINTIPTDAARLSIGCDESDIDQFNGHLAVFAYANVRKDNAFLASITTP